jgi:hypothetical protein
VTVTEIGCMLSPSIVMFTVPAVAKYSIWFGPPLSAIARMQIPHVA